MVRDLDLIKDIVTTNFDCFHINDTNVSKRYDPLMAVIPFFEENDGYRNVRKTVSALFTPSKVNKSNQFYGQELKKIIK